MERYWPIAISQEEKGPESHRTYESCTTEELDEWFKNIKKYGNVLVVYTYDSDGNIITFNSIYPSEETDLIEGKYCARTVIKNDNNSCYSFTTHASYDNLEDAINELDSIREQKPTIFGYIETKENGTRKIVSCENYLDFLGYIEKPGLRKRKGR